MDGWKKSRRHPVVICVILLMLNDMHVINHALPVRSSISRAVHRDTAIARREIYCASTNRSVGHDDSRRRLKHAIHIIEALIL